MPPADSIRKQIMDDLKSSLEVTAGSNYNYTPDRVEIVEDPLQRGDLFLSLAARPRAGVFVYVGVHLSVFSCWVAQAAAPRPVALPRLRALVGAGGVAPAGSPSGRRGR